MTNTMVRTIHISKKISIQIEMDQYPSISEVQDENLLIDKIIKAVNSVFETASDIKNTAPKMGRPAGVPNLKMKLSDAELIDAYEKANDKEERMALGKAVGLKYESLQQRIYYIRSKNGIKIKPKYNNKPVVTKKANKNTWVGPQGKAFIEDWRNSTTTEEKNKIVEKYGISLQSGYSLFGKLKARGY